MLGIDYIVSQLADTDEVNLVSTVKKWYEADVNRRLARSQLWSLAFQFFVGNQWIRWNSKTYRYDVIPTTDANKNIDRPVTNHFLRWMVINASQFTSRPSSVVDPNSDEPEDKTAAKVAEVIQNYLWEDMEKDDLYYEAALWGLLCGIVFRKSVKRLSGFHIERDSGTENIMMPSAEIVSPFNLSFDGLPSNWRNLSVIMESQPRRLEWIKAEYGHGGKGFIDPGKLEEKLHSENINEGPVAIGTALKDVISGADASFDSPGSTLANIENAAMVHEIYAEPTKKFPRGQMIVVASDLLLYQGPSPSYYLNGKIWHPYTCWTQFKNPASIFGPSLASLLIPIQRRINGIDALINFNRKTMVSGFWLIPDTAQIARGATIGVPGYEMRYTTDPSTGAKPERVPGTPLPRQVIEEREILLRDGDQLAFAADIRSGRNPTGVNTLGQLEILRDQAEIATSKQTTSWEKFIEKSEQLDLLVFQDCYKVPNKKMNKRFKRFSKDITALDWERFIGTDLKDNSSVRIEAGSTLTRSRLSRQNTVLRLAQAGLLGEILVDPYLHKKFLEFFGLEALFTDVNIDMQMAEKAIEMMKSGVYPPVIKEVHNPDIQLIVLSRYMKDPKFLELPDEIKNLFFRRYQEYIAELSKAKAVSPNEVPADPNAAKYNVGNVDSALTG